MLLLRCLTCWQCYYKHAASLWLLIVTYQVSTPLSQRWPFLPLFCDILVSFQVLLYYEKTLLLLWLFSLNILGFFVMTTLLLSQHCQEKREDCSLLPLPDWYSVFFIELTVIYFNHLLLILIPVKCRLWWYFNRGSFFLHHVYASHLYSYSPSAKQELILWCGHQRS